MSKKETEILFNVEGLKNKHSDIYLILSPPRCVSTAFSRVFWEQPSVGFYSFEPFEVAYFHGKSLEEIYKEKIDKPLDVRPLKFDQSVASGNALVIKEMPYQVGDYFPELVDLISKPVVTLIRDPRLSIASRMRKRKERGDNPLYPLVETGWDLLDLQLAYLQKKGIQNMIVETTDFRNFPSSIMSQVFEKLGLPFFESMLCWKPAVGTDVDNLEGPHRNQHERALLSSGIQPPTEEIPSFDWFPIEGGFRDHVYHAVEIYNRLAESSIRIFPES